MAHEAMLAKGSESRKLDDALTGNIREGTVSYPAKSLRSMTGLT